jgi:hypothetical protein
MSWETFREVLYGLAPTAGVVLIFYLVIRSIVRADSGEREAQRQFGRRRRADQTGNPDGSVPEDRPNGT